MFSNQDLELVYNQVLVENGLVSHHIDSANDLYERGIPQIIEDVFEAALSPRIDNFKGFDDPENMVDHIELSVKFTNVNVCKPSLPNPRTREDEIVFPNEALLYKQTYEAEVYVDVNIKATIIHKANPANKVINAKLERHLLGRVPIVVGSRWCNRYGLTYEELVRINEDPSDFGGYCIIDGVEWGSECIENVLFNSPRIFIQEGFRKEAFKMELISKPGDSYANSDQIIIRLMQNGNITIELIREDDYLGMHIPFFLVFRILGWHTDEQIVKSILYDMDSDLAREFGPVLQRAFESIYQAWNNALSVTCRTDVIGMLASKLKTSRKYERLDTTNPDHVQKIYDDIVRDFNIRFLPHMGKHSDDRDKKARYLALMIRKILLVSIGSIAPTDRDSFLSKRIYAFGTNYAKVMKTQFNSDIILSIRNNLVKNVVNYNIDELRFEKIVSDAIRADDFSKNLAQAIKAKGATTRKQKTKMSSNQLNRKSRAAALSTVRQVAIAGTEHSSTSDRSIAMRTSHPTALGYVDCLYSPDGEKVGINKAMAMYAMITTASSSEVIIQMLLADPDIKPLNQYLFHDDVITNLSTLSNVYVNGIWIGCCQSAIDIAIKYVKKRRALEIQPFVTIAWENTQDEVYFWTDVGRFIRPVLIVYNNRRDPEMFPDVDESKFEQKLAVTEEDIQSLYEGKYSVEDLLKRGIIEFITADEQTNIYIAADYSILHKDRHNELRQYTHCDVPSAQAGINILDSPFAGHNQLLRVSYSGHQSKQSGGVFAGNYPYRADKNTFLQYSNDMPLTSTISTKYTQWSGNNVMVALMCYNGFNIEDSLIFNKRAVEDGLFMGSKFISYMSKLEKKEEEFAVPDQATTKNIKTANYDKLVNGIIPIGTIVHKDDVLIGKIAKNTRDARDSIYQYTDHSTVYKDDEEGIVHNVIVARTKSKGEMFCNVVLRKVKKVVVGDKFSSRSGQKGTCGLLLNEEDMPYLENGCVPSIIMNPHGYPTRMTIGQIIEMMVNLINVQKGRFSDETMFNDVDIYALQKELEEVGYKYQGQSRMYNGLTGEPINSLIFIAPTFYRRIQKFSKDEMYAVSTGPSDCITMQPLDGKAVDGGLRIGEMEKDVLVAQGCMKTLTEKFRDHSDGYMEHVCRCGNPAVVNKLENIYECPHCRDAAEIFEYPISWAGKLFAQELNAANITLLRKPEPYVFRKKAPALGGIFA
jgi:DNA-directed RNA polymerase II subunit RPB2